MSITVAVSILGFLVSVFSFWWINVRTGVLKCVEPKSYAGAFNPDAKIVIPLSIHNTGQIPVTISDFRLHMATPEDGRRQGWFMDFYWTAIQPELEPAKVGGGRKLPSPISISGRQVIDMFIEFGHQAFLANLAEGPYSVRIDIFTGRRRKWTELISFYLHTELVKPETANRFISRTNDPEWAG